MGRDDRVEGGAPIRSVDTPGAGDKSGATKRFSAVRWGVGRNIAVAWLLTMPMAALMAALVDLALQPFF